MNDFNKLHALYHHGTKGMKWGIRKYQNEDGSLTEEGKKRYGIGKLANKSDREIFVTQRGKESSAIRDVLGEAGNIAGRTASLIPGKGRITHPDYSSITDDELRRRVNRLQMEESYANLTGQKQYIKSGSDYTREALQTFGTLTAIASSAVGIILAIKKIKGDAVTG